VIDVDKQFRTTLGRLIAPYIAERHWNCEDTPNGFRDDLMRRSNGLNVVANSISVTTTASTGTEPDAVPISPNKFESEMKRQNVFVFLNFWISGGCQRSLPGLCWLLMTNFESLYVGFEHHVSVIHIDNVTDISERISNSWYQEWICCSANKMTQSNINNHFWVSDWRLIRNVEQLYVDTVQYFPVNLIRWFLRFHFSANFRWYDFILLPYWDHMSRNGLIILQSSNYAIKSL
jgi:hypothetical protein